MWACGGTTCGRVVVLHVGVWWYYMWACGGTTCMRVVVLRMGE